MSGDCISNGTARKGCCSPGESMGRGYRNHYNSQETFCTPARCRVGRIRIPNELFTRCQQLIALMWLPSSSPIQNEHQASEVWTLWVRPTCTRHCLWSSSAQNKSHPIRPSLSFSFGTTSSYYQRASRPDRTRVKFRPHGTPGL